MKYVLKLEVTVDVSVESEKSEKDILHEIYARPPCLDVGGVGPFGCYNYKTRDKVKAISYQRARKGK